MHASLAPPVAAAPCSNAAPPDSTVATAHVANVLMRTWGREGIERSAARVDVRGPHGDGERRACNLARLG